MKVINKDEFSAMVSSHHRYLEGQNDGLPLSIKNAMLVNLKLENANLESAFFSGCIFISCHFIKVSFAKATFQFCEINMSELDECSMRDSSFICSTMCNLTIEKEDFSGANFNNSGIFNINNKNFASVSWSEENRPENMFAIKINGEVVYFYKKHKKGYFNLLQSSLYEKNHFQILRAANYLQQTLTSIE